MTDTTSARILLLVSDPERGRSLQETLQTANRHDQVIEVQNLDEAVRKAGESPCDVAVVEGEEGLSFIAQAADLGLDLAIILIAPDENADLIDKARMAGASDALFQSEITPQVLDHALRQALHWRPDVQADEPKGDETKGGDLLDMKRAESLARFASGIAHEIKNPLSIILLAADYVARPKPLSPEDQARIASYLRDGADRIENILTEMLGACAPKQLLRQPMDPVVLIEEALRAVGADKWEAAKIRLVRNFADDLPKVFVDRNRMVEALVHLLSNAADVMPDGGVISIQVYPHLFEVSEREEWQRAAWFWAGDTAVIIDICDTGPGIPAEKLHHVYEPFFTTKPAGKGSGLGLTATKKILELHGGRVSITNRPEGGAQARVTLKTSSQAARAS